MRRRGRSGGSRLIARIVTYAVLVALAVFVLSTTFLLDGGGSSAQPDDGLTSVHDLSINPPKHRGRTVTTGGILNYSVETQQYQVIDDNIAVVVRDYDSEALQSLSGQQVLVTGRFDFDSDTGIYIDAETIEVKD